MYILVSLLRLSWPTNISHVTNSFDCLIGTHSLLHTSRITTPDEIHLVSKMSLAAQISGRKQDKTVHRMPSKGAVLNNNRSSPTNSSLLLVCLRMWQVHACNCAALQQRPITSITQSIISGYSSEECSRTATDPEMLTFRVSAS